MPDTQYKAITTKHFFYLEHCDVTEVDLLDIQFYRLKIPLLEHPKAHAEKKFWDWSSGFN